jgi:glycosyltransferase involved in cell wall biosynthesis
MRATIGDDPRFQLSPAPRNRGFYENFERALTLVPEEADLVALCDQDDEWHPDKLEALIAKLAPEAGLAYSDMRIVERGGRVLSETYWEFRSNNYTDFGSLLIANTVTGAASLFRRELLDDVLPFPPRHAAAYHDHWIAQVAMALGPISYVDRPLYDYVQHDAAAIGYLAANGDGRFSASLIDRSRITWRRFRGRRYRLGWRQPYFNIYVRIALGARLLRARCGGRMAPERLALVETLIDPRRARSWLLRRVLRDGLRSTETLGRERVMLAGLAWSGARAGRRRLAGAVSRPAGPA